MKGTISVRRRITSGEIRDNEARDIRLKQQERLSEGIFLVAIAVGGILLCSSLAFILWIAS